MVELYKKDNIMTGGGMGDYSLGATYGLKDEKGNVILEPKYRNYGYSNGIYAFADDVHRNALNIWDTSKKYFDAVYFNKQGEKLTERKIKEGYEFNEDGFAVVYPSDINYTNGAKYLLMTKNGFISSFPRLKPEEAKLCCPADLEQAIKDCGAVAVKYATPEVVGRKKVTSKETYIEEYREALKEYLKNLDYADKTEKECKKIIKAEFKLFKELVKEKLKVVKKEKAESLKKQKLNGYIENK